MIKTGGKNVSTREVEEFIYQDSRIEEPPLHFLFRNIR